MATKLPNRKRFSSNIPRIWDINDLLECIESHGDKVCYKYFEKSKVKEMIESGEGCKGAHIEERQSMIIK